MDPNSIPLLQTVKKELQVGSIPSGMQRAIAPGTQSGKQTIRQNNSFEIARVGITKSKSERFDSFCKNKTYFNQNVSYEISSNLMKTTWKTIKSYHNNYAREK